MTLNVSTLTALTTSLNTLNNLSVNTVASFKSALNILIPLINTLLSASFSGSCNVVYISVSSGNRLNSSNPSYFLSRLSSYNDRGSFSLSSVASKSSSGVIWSESRADPSSPDSSGSSISSISSISGLTDSTSDISVESLPYSINVSSESDAIPLNAPKSNFSFISIFSPSSSTTWPNVSSNTFIDASLGVGCSWGGLLTFINRPCSLSLIWFSLVKFVWSASVNTFLDSMVSI